MHQTLNISAIYEPLSAEVQHDLNRKLHALALTTCEACENSRRHDLLTAIRDLEAICPSWIEHYYETSAYVSVIRRGDTWMLEVAARDWEVML